MDPKNVEALVNMLVPTTPQDIQVFNEMAQFYWYFIKNFALIMSPIIEMFKKYKGFEWIEKCQNAWEEIKNQYVQAPILINPNWELEFHIHTYAPQLVVGAILT